MIRKHSVYVLTVENIKVTLIEIQQPKCSVCGSKMIDDIHSRGNSYVETPENVANMVDMIMDGGSKFLIEPVEMTIEEFKALPEFSGF